jgi:hypothetical protein
MTDTEVLTDLTVEMSNTISDENDVLSRMLAIEMFLNEKYYGKSLRFPNCRQHLRKLKNRSRLSVDLLG